MPPEKRVLAGKEFYQNLVELFGLFYRDPVSGIPNDYVPAVRNVLCKDILRLSGYGSIAIARNHQGWKPDLPQAVADIETGQCPHSGAVGVRVSLDHLFNQPLAKNFLIWVGENASGDRFSLRWKAKRVDKDETQKEVWQQTLAGDVQVGEGIDQNETRHPFRMI